MKRLLSCLLAVTMLLAAPVALADIPNIAEADGMTGAILMEPGTGTRLWGKDADMERSVAGLSKLPAILTLAQAFDEGSISESTMMRVSEKAAAIAGPTAFLNANEEIAARELIKSAVMISAGDAIMTLGETAYGSESIFVENINVTLRQLGMNKAMTDAMGNGMLFSPWELATLGKAAVKSPTFSKYCMLYLDAVAHADGRETELVNANRLIKNYSGCKGVLTGSSATDGYCGVFAAERNGTCLVAVVTGGENAVKRTAAAVALLDYGFANYRVETLCKAGNALAKDVPVRDGDVRTVNLVPREDVVMVTESKKAKLTLGLEVPEYLEAPVAADVSVGTATYTDEAGKSVATVPLYVEREIPAYGIKDLLLRIIALFIG